MIITISGVPGSGKSSVAKKVAEKLRFKYVSIGSMIREEAQKNNQDVLTLMQNHRAFTAIQQRVERKLDLLEEQDNTIIDGRDAFYHIKNSLKVFLLVDLTTAAQRIMNDNRTSEQFITKEQACTSIQERMNREAQLYKDMHGIDIYNNKHYDLVIDTTNLTIEEVTNQILLAALPI